MHQFAPNGCQVMNQWLTHIFESTVSAVTLFGGETNSVLLYVQANNANLQLTPYGMEPGIHLENRTKHGVTRTHTQQQNHKRQTEELISTSPL